MATGPMENLNWRYVDSKTGKTAIQIPSDASDVLVDISYSGGTMCYSFYLAKNMLNTTGKRYTQGYYFSSGNSFCQIDAKKESVAINNFIINGTDYSGSTTITVYVK